MTSRLQTIRLRRTEKKVADIIALPIALVLSILFYIGQIILKALWKVRRILWKFSVTFMVILFLTNAIGVLQASAPKANATAPVLPAVQQTQYDQIKAYIETVFGPDAPKAFQLLDGNGKCPGENGSLNPNAQNYNSDGSIDYSIFQINNKWQGVSNTAFLFDWKINILMAYNIYIRSNHTFKMWTGGKCQGI